MLTRSGDDGPSAAVDEHIEQVPAPARSVPELNDGQILDIERLIASDPRLKTIVRGTNYTIGRVGPWMSGSKEPIGGIVELILDQPVAYNGVVPLVKFESDENSEKQYQGKEFIVEAQAITSLYILVDFAEDAIVGIEVAKAGGVAYSDKPDRRE